MMSLVSVIIVILGNLSLEISLDEKRKEVDDFASSILKEFEIMQNVEGGYFRNIEISDHFMSRFNVRIDGDYLIVSDLFSYESETDFVRYYKIPGENYISTNLKLDGSLDIILCKNYLIDENRVDFLRITAVNDNFCFDKLVKEYVRFSPNSTDMSFANGITTLNIDIISNLGTNRLYLRDFESGIFKYYDFGVTSFPTTLELEVNLSSSYLIISFQDDTNVQSFNLENNGIINSTIGYIIY